MILKSSILTPNPSTQNRSLVKATHFPKPTGKNLKMTLIKLSNFKKFKLLPKHQVVQKIPYRASLKYNKAKKSKNWGPDRDYQNECKKKIRTEWDHINHVYKKPNSKPFLNYMKSKKKTSLASHLFVDKDTS
ncbi:hypothetical protein MAR_037782 [Mya arenaria]|uniref:Uncharacterized protein n=1 Tax=Mya arenaria TaxID=6604 RepID=A0ABY7FTI0_MYAAR|nr:hypothetical protein MAR_037782 [Mya arenaria]